MKVRPSVKGVRYADRVQNARPTSLVFRLGSFALLFVGAAGAACSPSYQAVYEGNVRFEHCYALEENPQKTMPEKARCWRDWSERYTFGQTRDRVQYAISRYVALSEMNAAPTDEAMMMAAPGETPRSTTILAPAPTNAFAPPPKVLDVDGGMLEKTATPGRPGEGNGGGLANVPTLSIDGGLPAAPVQPALPLSSCTDGCGSDYKRCAASCEGDAGPTSKSCTRCKHTYRSCMRGCFK